MIIEQCEEFTKWLDCFCGRKMGVYPEPDWFERVQSSHKGIRKLIGGVSIEEDICIEAGNKPISARSADIMANRINIYFPKYAESFKITNLAEFIRYPMGHIGKSKRKIGKHLSAYAAKNMEGQKSEDIAYYINEMAYIVNSLNEYWAQNTWKEANVRAELYTSAKSFMLLGHYGPDGESCFGQGHDNDTDKLSLGSGKNSFVLVLKQKHGTGYRTMLRCWGFMASNRTSTSTALDTMNICNVYERGIGEACFEQVCRKLFHKIFGVEVVSLTKDAIETPEGIYLNDHILWSFSTQKSVDTQGIYDLNCYRDLRDDHEDDDYYE